MSRDVTLIGFTYRPNHEIYADLFSDQINIHLFSVKTRASTRFHRSSQKFEVGCSKKEPIIISFCNFFFELFQLEIFSFQLLQQKLTISIGKMFSMDYELIYSVSSPTKHKTIIKKYKPTIIFSR